MDTPMQRVPSRLPLTMAMAKAGAHAEPGEAVSGLYACCQSSGFTSGTEEEETEHVSVIASARTDSNIE